MTAAALVALNSLKMGAYWPINVVGVAAIGLLSTSTCWLVAKQMARRARRRGDVRPRRPLVA